MVLLYESVEKTSTQFLFSGYQSSKARRGREGFMMYGTMELGSTRVSATERTPSLRPSFFPSTSKCNNPTDALLCFIYLLLLKYSVLANGMLYKSVHLTGKYLSMNTKIPPTFLKRTSFLGQALSVK